MSDATDLPVLTHGSSWPIWVLAIIAVIFFILFVVSFIMWAVANGNYQNCVKKEGFKQDNKQCKIHCVRQC